MNTSSPSRATPASVPATIVSGSPIASSRRGTTYSRRNAARLIRDASEKSTTTSVASATQRTVSLPIVGSSQPRTSSLARMPPATNTIAAVTTVPERRRDTAAYARTRRASDDEARAAHPSVSVGLRANDAAKAEVRRRRVDRLPLSRRGSIAQAVVRCAEVRAALDHAARDRLTGMGSGEVTRGLRGTQHGLSTSSACRVVNQSDVHSQTFPVMSKRP